MKDTRKFTQTTQIIPASPGWKLLEPIHEDELANEIDDTPVIAWFVVLDADAFGELCTVVTSPIVTNTVSLPRRWALESPDGKINIPEDRDFMNRADLLHYWKTDDERTVAKSA